MPIPIEGPLSAYFDWIDERPQTEGVIWEIGRRRSFVREQLVKVKVKGLGPIDVGLCPGLPSPGSFYIADPMGGPILSGDAAAIMVRQSAQRMNPSDPADWPYWVVRSEYSTELPFRQDTYTGPGNKDNPENELAQIDWDFEEMMIARPVDLNGNPYHNPAGHPYTPPMQVPAAVPVVYIARNELSFSKDKASKVAYALNDDTFLATPRGCVQILPPKSSQKNTGHIRYQRTSYRLKFRPLDKNGGYFIPVYGGVLFADRTKIDAVVDQGVTGNYPYKLIDSWQPTVLCQGLYRRGKQGRDMDALVGKPVPIYRQGVPIQHPVPLDDEGQEIDTDPTKGIPKCWLQRFEDFRYQNIKDLLVTGLS